MSDRDVWFEYAWELGRLSAVPVSWKGWVALIAIIILPTAALLGFGLPFLRAHRPWLGPAIAADVILCLTVVFSLVFAKGRRRA